MKIFNFKKKRVLDLNDYVEINYIIEKSENKYLEIDNYLSKHRYVLLLEKSISQNISIGNRININQYLLNKTISDFEIEYPFKGLVEDYLKETTFYVNDVCHDINLRKVNVIISDKDSVEIIFDYKLMDVLYNEFIEEINSKHNYSNDFKEIYDYLKKDNNLRKKDKYSGVEEGIMTETISRYIEENIFLDYHFAKNIKKNELIDPNCFYYNNLHGKILKTFLLCTRRNFKVSYIKNINNRKIELYLK